MPVLLRKPRKCGNLNVSQPHWPRRPVTGIALPLSLPFYKNIKKFEWSEFWHELLGIQRNFQCIRGGHSSQVRFFICTVTFN
jgi:hypothetical protein